MNRKSFEKNTSQVLPKKDTSSGNFNLSSSRYKYLSPIIRRNRSKSVKSSKLLVLKERTANHKISNKPLNKLNRSRSSSSKQENNFLISYKNEVIFKRFKKKCQKPQGSSKEQTFSYMFTMNYNKNPLECIKIFENLLKKKHRFLSVNEPNRLHMFAEPNQRFNIDHNLQILKFQEKQKKQHPLYRRNYGIKLDTPEFIKFPHFSRRLREQLMMEEKCFDIKVPQSEKIEERPSSVQMLG